jgi:hypothetical protein
MVRKYIKDRRDILKEIYFPKGSSEFNAVVECWRRGKYDLLVSKYYPRFENLTYAIANYYRTKRFKLHIVKYLLRNMSLRINVSWYSKNEDASLVTIRNGSADPRLIKIQSQRIMLHLTPSEQINQY